MVLRILRHQPSSPKSHSCIDSWWYCNHRNSQTEYLCWLNEIKLGKNMKYKTKIQKNKRINKYKYLWKKITYTTHSIFSKFIDVKFYFYYITISMRSIALKCLHYNEILKWFYKKKNMTYQQQVLILCTTVQKIFVTVYLI